MNECLTNNLLTRVGQQQIVSPSFTSIDYSLLPFTTLCMLPHDTTPSAQDPGHAQTSLVKLHLFSAPPEGSDFLHLIYFLGSL
jgi:hypothetical protein